MDVDTSVDAYICDVSSLLTSSEFFYHTEDNGIKVYPNPTSGKFTVMASEAKQSQIEIYNVYGEKVHSLNHPLAYLLIDLSSQPSGVYFIHFITDKGTIAKKIILTDYR